MSGANGVERRLYRKEDSMDSIDTPPLYSGDSTMSLTSARHPLVWVFNRFRQEGKTSLCKDDLSKLVGPQVDPIQLDLAFENLDADHDGQVTIDEFIAGFSRFWCETPDTPKQEVSPLHSTRPRLLTEEHYEYGGEESVEDVGPDEQFHTTLGVLSSHNRHSMEHLWRALKEANPELLTDFEEFVSEVTSEVEGAQRALDNQRKANKKEAMELDDEIESRLSAAQTTLHIQTSLVRQEEKTKLERRLVSKESELFSVRHQLQELESEIVETQQNRQELEQQCQDLSKEKEELKEKLEISERMLHETKSKGQKIEQLEIQQKQQSYQEVELLQQKKSYEEEISKLRKELEQYSRREIATEDQEVESLMAGGVARPDLLVAHHNNQDTGSLMMEIVEKEGIASPMILKEQVLLPSPFLRTARAGSMRGRGKKASNLKSQAVLSLSLPNLADVDYLESLESPQPANRYSVLIPSPGPQLDSPSPPDNHFTPLSPPRQSLVGMGTDQHPLNWLAQDSIDPNCKPLEFLEILPGQPDYIFKVLVVGNSYVGKSSFLMQLCNHSFSQRYSSTIGVDFYTKALKMDDKVLSLQLWDTAGQERFQSVTKAYYRGAQGVILMYDISQEESFIAVKSWINSIQENAEEVPAAMCLVGNKQDLIGEREVSTETGETFAKIYGADFIETSAKTGYNVGNSLLRLVRSLKTYYEEDSNDMGTRSKQKLASISVEETKPSESKCCS